jgi:hypothetical protein
MTLREKAEKLFFALNELSSQDNAIKQVERALIEAREQAFEEMRLSLSKYREAYDESIFPPKDMEQFDPDVRTAVAGRMGRFVLDNCLKDVEALKSKAGE